MRCPYLYFFKLFKKANVFCSFFRRFYFIKHDIANLIELETGTHSVVNMKLVVKRLGWVRKKWGLKHPLYFKHCPASSTEPIFVVVISKCSLC